MSGGGIVVVASADERYIMPLTVMVRSLLENLESGVSVDLYVFEDATTANSRRRAEDSWRPFPVRSHWITPDQSGLEGKLQDRGYAGQPATYFRLLAGDLLPPEVTKAIYLDSDILVLGDVSELWNMEMNGKLALAVPDAYARAFHLRRLNRGALKEEIRFGLQSSYFNAGVLVIDVEGWRREDVGERALRFAEEYREELTFHDQDVLNCVLRERWGALGPTWNLHELSDCLFLWDNHVYSRCDLPQAIMNPNIVHFTGRAKPWMRWCFNVRAEEFCDCFLRTYWTEELLEGQSGIAGHVRRLLIMPHSRMNQLVWRRNTSIGSAGRFRSALLILVTHPWMPITYPLWQMLVWLYFLLFLPIDRRSLFPGRL
jgi:lipopolysaccharide biosynthesis glycosyltransferase